MKYILVLITCISGFVVTAQTSKDSLLNELKEFREMRGLLVTELEQLKDSIERVDMLIQDITEKYHANLFVLDSLIGEQNRLERKKQRTAAEQKKLNETNKLVNKTKSAVIKFERELYPIESKKTARDNEVQKAKKLIEQLDMTIKELEELLKE